jgi:ectoine hydroxylase-related dioxygenase (phytanoyl-CoA dioxygenase family)
VVLSAVRHVLRRDFKLSSLNARDAEPGHGHQSLHTDWEQPTDRYQVVNSIWMLDEFTPTNGATRIVPGTHRLLRHPDVDPHPREIPITGPAGTVVGFNSHLWHGGTKNHSRRPRRALFAYYTARENPQQTNQQEFITPQTYRRLSPEARRLLDVESPSMSMA